MSLFTNDKSGYWCLCLLNVNIDYCPNIHLWWDLSNPWMISYFISIISQLLSRSAYKIICPNAKWNIELLVQNSFKSSKVHLTKNAPFLSMGSCVTPQDSHPQSKPHQYWKRHFLFPLVLESDFIKLLLFLFPLIVSLLLLILFHNVI